jgi:hypothetical protein
LLVGADSTGSVTTGFGPYIDLIADGAGYTEQTMARIIGKNNGAYNTGQLDLHVFNAGVETSGLTITPTGHLNFIGSIYDSTVYEDMWLNYKSKARTYLSGTDQTLNDGAGTGETIYFNAENWDSNAENTIGSPNSKFAPKTNGFYQVNGGVLGDQTLNNLFFKVNGTVVSQTGDPAGALTHLTLSDIIYLGSNSSLTMDVAPTNPGTRAIAGTEKTFMSVHRMCGSPY